MKTELPPIVTLAMEEMIILRLQEVIFRTGLRRSTLYDLIAKEEFPHPISISTRTVGWIEGEIIEWIVNRAINYRKTSSKKTDVFHETAEIDEAE